MFTSASDWKLYRTELVNKLLSIGKNFHLRITWIYQRCRRSTTTHRRVKIALSNRRHFRVIIVIYDVVYSKRHQLFSFGTLGLWWILSSFGRIKCWWASWKVTFANERLPMPSTIAYVALIITRMAFHANSNDIWDSSTELRGSSIIPTRAGRGRRKNLKHLLEKVKYLRTVCIMCVPIKTRTLSHEFFNEFRFNGMDQSMYVCRTVSTTNSALENTFSVTQAKRCCFWQITPITYILRRVTWARCFFSSFCCARVGGSSCKPVYSVIECLRRTRKAFIGHNLHDSTIQRC